jgi:hypothetical protein
MYIRIYIVLHLWFFASILQKPIIGYLDLEIEIMLVYMHNQAN